MLDMRMTMRIPQRCPCCQGEPRRLLCSVCQGKGVRNRYGEHQAAAWLGAAESVQDLMVRLLHEIRKVEAEEQQAQQRGWIDEALVHGARRSALALAVQGIDLYLRQPRRAVT